MKIIIESTERTVILDTADGRVPARMWQGKTDEGIPVICFVTRIVPEIAEGDPRYAQVISAFDRELRACVPARPAVDAFDMRLII